MEKWGKPPATPPVATRSTARSSGGTGGGTVQPSAPKVGFAKAFADLAGRKLREMLGRKWEGASERARTAEANRRAAAEMARRIERQTGRRPKESTIRRAAREDRTPRGADQQRLDRQARVDAAGGAKKFADKAGVPAGRVAGWIARGAIMGVGGVRTTVSVNGDMYSPPSNPTPYRKSIDAVLRIDPPAADDFRAAFADGDLDALARMLGPVIDEQYEWTGGADRMFVVTEITDITIE